MKSYKLVNSKEVRDKAERLGFNTSQLQFGAVLFIASDDREYFTRDIQFYSIKNDGYLEITQADFLALPEPFKVGDWVKFESNGDSYIFQIREIRGSDQVIPKSIITRNWDKSMYAHSAGNCTKLTPEQIEILELEQ